MKICHVITSLVYGGAERLLVNTLQIHAQDHEVTVIYLKGVPQLVPALPAGVAVHYVALGSGCVRQLRDLITAVAPDVVHTQLGHADFLGQWAARHLRVARICTMQNIHFKWDWRDRLIFAAYRVLLRRIVPSCHVLGISNSVTRHVEQRLGVPKERSSMLYLAIPDLELAEDRVALRQELGIPPDAFCLLFVGRLRVQKSVPTLLRAAAAVRSAIPGLRVLVVGEGDQRPALERLVAELGLGDGRSVPPAGRAFRVSSRSSAMPPISSASTAASSRTSKASRRFPRLSAHGDSKEATATLRRLL